MKPVQFLLFVLFMVVAGGLVQADPFMDWYKKISATELELGVHILPKEKVKELLKDAEPLIQQGTDDPTFYLQAGVFAKMLDEEYSSYFRMAMDVDDDPSAPSHLDADALVYIGSDMKGQGQLFT